MLAGQALVFAAFFGLWELAVRLLHTRPVILPAPSVVFAKIWEQRDLLLANTWPTCVAIALGFRRCRAVGVHSCGRHLLFARRARADLPFSGDGAGAAESGVRAAVSHLVRVRHHAQGRDRRIDRVLPIVINTAKGLSSVEVELLQYMDSLGAKTSEKFLKISLPWALPYIFAAFKISITLAIVGAVVGEFVAAGEGLGYVINAANIALDTELMFAGILVLSLLGILMFLAVVLAEQMVTGEWQQSDDGVQATM